MVDIVIPCNFRGGSNVGTVFWSGKDAESDATCLCFFFWGFGRLLDSSCRFLGRDPGLTRCLRCECLHMRFSGRLIDWKHLMTRVLFQKPFFGVFLGPVVAGFWEGLWSCPIFMVLVCACAFLGSGSWLGASVRAWLVPIAPFWGVWDPKSQKRFRFPGEFSPFSVVWLVEWMFVCRCVLCRVGWPRVCSFGWFVQSEVGTDWKLRWDKCTFWTVFASFLGGALVSPDFCTVSVYICVFWLSRLVEGIW